jgi:hypothetical protein
MAHEATMQSSTSQPTPGWRLNFVAGFVPLARFFNATGQPFILLPYPYCVLMLAGLLNYSNGR